MEMTSNCDVTNSTHQIQMTTIWPWTKPPHGNFLRTPLVELQQFHTDLHCQNSCLSEDASKLVSRAWNADSSVQILLLIFLPEDIVGMVDAQYTVSTAFVFLGPSNSLSFLHFNGYRTVLYISCNIQYAKGIRYIIVILQNIKTALVVNLFLKLQNIWLCYTISDQIFSISFQIPLLQLG